MLRIGWHEVGDLDSRSRASPICGSWYGEELP